MRDAEPGLDGNRRRRKGVVGRRGGEHDQVDVGGIEARVGERRARGVQADVGRELAGRRYVALADAGALHDPLVGSIDHARQLVIGEDPLRQVAAATHDDRSHRAHEATSPIINARSSPRLY